MGVDFDIIDKNGNLIDRYSIKWLAIYYNSSFCLDHSGCSIKYIINYCDEQIEKLIEKINILESIINIWNEKDFQKRKKLKIDLLSNINDEKEFYSIIKYFAEYDIEEDIVDYVKLTNNSKLIEDFNYYFSYKSHFTNFKDFLLKYQNCKYEFSY